MKTTTKITAGAAAAVALAAAPGAIATGVQAYEGRSAADGTTSAQGSATQGSTGSTGSADAGSSADATQTPQWTRRNVGNGYGYESYGSGSTGTGSAGSSTGSGSSGVSQTADGSLVSGTPITSMKGVVLIDTVLDGGEGKGTGMVLTSDGEVLTNYHVVDGSTSITVTDTVSGKTYQASVVGHDETHDIAVLQLKDASGLATVNLSQTTAQVGAAVTAVGQGGGQGTLYQVSGTVSALGQSITAQDSSSASSAEKLTGLIQTTADVVPGYSGGPLLDTDGQVIGIDTAASSSGDIDGYAVPITEAKSIADQIVAGTRTATVHIGPRAALGVQVTDSGSSASGYGQGYGQSYGQGYGRGSGQSYGQGYDPQSGSTNSTTSTSGAAVAEVVSGSAAAKAGITAGSTITAVDGQSVASAAALSSELSDDYPGTSVKVTWTDASGTAHTATVTLGTSTVN